MAILELFHVERYSVHFAQIPKNQPESCPKTNLALRLRLYRSGADRISFLLEGGQEGVDIHVGEFPGLIRLRVAILPR